MGKTDKEVLELCKSWFEDIVERSDRLTSGNVAHGRAAIRGVAKNYAEFVNEHLESFSKFINTLEVKEVDLDEEFDKYCATLYLIDLENEPYAELFECAKHFFELGVKAAQKGETNGITMQT